MLETWLSIGNNKDLLLTIKKNQLAKDIENQRETRFTPGQKVDVLIQKLDKKKREVQLSIKALEEKESKEALKKYGSEDSGMKLRDILGPLISKKKKKKLADINSIPNNDNLDVPINTYDKLLEQKLNNNYDSDSDIEISDEQENFDNKENYVTLLIDENIKLKNMIEEIKNTSYDRNDNIFDLIIFLSTGIFVIFLLDTVTKSIRKF